MAKLDLPRFNRRDLFYAAVVAAVIAADQLTKLWIRTRLAPGQILHDFGVFQILHVRNTGAAFGIFRGHTTALIIIDFIGIAVLLYLIFFLRDRWPFLDKIPVRLSIALILAGTVGNLIDRLWLGRVTDFIDFKVWPVFNISDASVSVGVVVLAYCLIFLTEQPKSKE
jgi:signal peptidase II